MTVAVIENVHRLDAVEELAERKGWGMSRTQPDEVNLFFEIRGADLHAVATYLEDYDALHLAFSFDIKVPRRRIVEVRMLASIINEQLWVGHFDFWPDVRKVLYRHALLLAGQEEVADPCEALVAHGMAVSERYLPAFQQVARYDIAAKEGLTNCQFETQGNA
jgi:hypothetical protein